MVEWLSWCTKLSKLKEAPASTARLLHFLWTSPGSLLLTDAKDPLSSSLLMISLP